MGTNSIDKETETRAAEAPFWQGCLEPRSRSEPHPGLEQLAGKRLGSGCHADALGLYL